MMNVIQRRLLMVITLVALAGILLYVTARPDNLAMARGQAATSPTATTQPKLKEFLDEIPYPRIYAFYHNLYPCISGGQKGYFVHEMRYANVAELYYRLGSAKTEAVHTPSYESLKFDANDDGDCDDPDDMRVVDWLEHEWKRMSPNAHHISVPHYQLAFLPLWNFREAGDGLDAIHRDTVDECDTAYTFIPTPTPTNATPPTPGGPPTSTPIPTATPDADYLEKQVWALHKAQDANNAGEVILWTGGADLRLINVYAGTPIATSVSIHCNTQVTEGLNPEETPASRTYHEWMPLWVEARIGETRLDEDPYEVNPWDGIRIDSQANLFSWAGDADFDLDGSMDTHKREDGSYGKDPTSFGRHYLDDLYQQGVDKLFQNIYQNHAGEWLMGGNDAWHPNGGGPDDPSGFGELPSMHFTIAENWTKDWGSNGQFHFMRWPNPDDGKYSSNVTFSDAVRIWDTWTHKGNGRKGFVIFSKCDDPLNNGCKGLEEGSLTDNEYGWADMHREFRFSLAAALMLDAYHAFTGEGYHMTPYWYDEYAVFWDGGKAQAARNDDEKAKGIGWLGYPVSDPLGVDGGGEITNTSLCQALENTRSGQSPKVDDFPAWIRYFEYGVAILNPSSQATTVKLDPNVTYYRIQCSKGNNSRVDADVDCVTNNGQTVENHQVTIGPYDGLVLYGEANQTDKIAISASEYDIQYREAQELLFDDRNNQTWQWNNYTDETGPTINIVNDELREVYSGRLIFSINNTDLQQAIKNGDIIDAYLSLNTSLELNDASMWLVVQRSPDDPEESNLKVPWTDRHLLGEGWHRTPSLKKALVQLANQAGWDGRVEFYLDPDSFSHHLAFKTFDSGTVNAPTLVIIRKKKVTSSCTTTNTTGTYQITYQHGANGYNGGEDTYIVTTDWEPPTTHDTFPALYIRVNYPNDQIYSSLIRFNDAALPAGAEIVKAQLDMYYAGQSVNGGDLTAYVAYTKEPWKASETTWVNFQTSFYWNATGVKGVDDRDPHVYVLPVNYQQVGNWLSFDVTQVVKDTPGDDYDFFFYGSFAGVNKNIYFRSNDYWKVSERPKLTIWYKMP